MNEATLGAEQTGQATQSRPVPLQVPRIARHRCAVPLVPRPGQAGVAAGRRRVRPAWTTLYGLMSVASARALDHTEDPWARRAFAAAFGTKRALNASWNWLSFKASSA